MKQYVFFILYCCISIGVFSKENTATSLEQQLFMHPDKDTSRVDILNKLSESHLSMQPELSIKYSNEALQIADSINYLRGKAQSFNQIGNYYSYTAVYQSAINFLNKSISLFNSIHNDTGRANCYISLGYILAVQGEFPKSLKYLNDAETIYKVNKNQKKLADCDKIIGDNYKARGNNLVALEYYQKTLKIYEELKFYIGVADVYNSIGLLYKIIKEYTKALYYLNNALKTYEKLGNEKRMQHCLNNIGVLYFDQKQYTQALYFYKRAQIIAEKNNEKLMLSIIMANLASIYEELNNYELSILYHEKAIREMIQIGSKKNLCIEYLNVGSLYMKVKNYNKAFHFLNLSNNLANELHLLEIQRDINEVLSTLYKGFGDFKKAYECQVAFKKYNDSIFNEENFQKFTEMELTYKFEKEKNAARHEQQKRDAIEQEKKKRQKIAILSLIFGMLMLIGLIFLIFKNYKQQIKTNQLLSMQQAIIVERNEELKVLNEEIIHQRDRLFQQNKDITDSITYTRIIQEALLSSHEVLDNCGLRNFILYKPRDIISGDFYWFKKINNLVYFSAADCTGHGVPGAFMSVLGISLLNDIEVEHKVISPAVMLNELRKRLKVSLRQDKQASITKDGMDISMCLLDLDTLQLEYAGAYNPLIVIRKEGLIEIEADKMPVAVHPHDKAGFTNHVIQLQADDTIYIFSDGYMSQFGGPNRKKINIAQYKKLLMDLQAYPIEVQKNQLDEFLRNWQGDMSQIDDILVIGIKV